MRVEIRCSTSWGMRYQSAVIKSSVVTARMTTVLSYVRASPMTPTDWTGSSTANACQMLGEAECFAHLADFVLEEFSQRFD